MGDRKLWWPGYVIDMYAKMIWNAVAEMSRIENQIFKHICNIEHL